MISSGKTICLSRISYFPLATPLAVAELIKEETPGFDFGAGRDRPLCLPGLNRGETFYLFIRGKTKKLNSLKAFYPKARKDEKMLEEVQNRKPNPAGLTGYTGLKIFFPFRKKGKKSYQFVR